MPAPIITGLINLMVSKLSITVFDGEIPRDNTDSSAINPSATSGVIPNWPVVRVTMPDDGFEREWTTEDPYTDTGIILIQVWGTSRTQTEVLLNSIEALFAQASKWAEVSLGGPVTNPYYIIQMLLQKWYSGQEEGVRTSASQLLYRCDLYYYVQIHGAVSTA